MFHLYLRYFHSATLFAKISLVAIFKQEDGLANPLDDIHIKITAENFNDVRAAAHQFMQDYNSDPTNRARVYDWFIAESEDLMGVGVNLTEDDE